MVKIRDPQHLDDSVLDGVAKTFSQLSRLGLISIIILDTAQAHRPGHKDVSSWKAFAIEQANRVTTAIEAHESEARIVDDVVGVFERSSKHGNATRVEGPAYISYRKLLMTPLKRGIIPIIPGIAYTERTQVATPVEANDVVIALTRELAGLQVKALPDEDPMQLKERMQKLRKDLSVDRLIILDPLGGIPTSDQTNGYHVFLNMQQEFESVKQDLSNGTNRDAEKNINKVSAAWLPSEDTMSGSKSITEEHEQLATTTGMEESPISSSNNEHHLRNLELVNTVLSLLPPNSSALLTTPSEAANSSKEHSTPFRAAEVGTRRHRNPLIHNLLTDKPVFSPSLPRGRFSSPINSITSSTPTIAPTTFAKHGTSVTIFPDPKVAPWVPPRHNSTNLTLTSSHLYLARLVYLIEDSFGRKLDLSHYLQRVNNRIAGVIIAGEYEGGALVTWELPPGVVDDGSKEARKRWVLYLDKFAVLKRSQGAGGVADVVFKALVRECAAAGCVWRSRKASVVLLSILPREIG